MPNAGAARQTPGKVSIDLTPGKERVEIDGYRLEQHVTALTLSYDAATRRPFLVLNLLPLSADVTGTDVEWTEGIREFLIAQGWTPPK